MQDVFPKGELLINDLPSLKFESLSGDVIIVLDNCGAELLADLRLAWTLLALPSCRSVALHCKFHPVFVSDALVGDVQRHVKSLAGTDVGDGLELAISNGRLRLEAHAFYCSPVEFAHAPASLKTVYDASALVIIKGDAK